MVVAPWSDQQSNADRTDCERSRNGAEYQDWRVQIHTELTLPRGLSMLAYPHPSDLYDGCHAFWLESLLAACGHVGVPRKGKGSSVIRSADYCTGARSRDTT